MVKLLTGLSGYGIMLAVVLAAIGAAWWRFDSVIDQNKILTEQIGTLKSTVELQNATIKNAEEALLSFQQEQIKFNLQLDEIQKGQIEASSSIRRINGLFSKHDFRALVRAKPGLLERRINSGSERARQLLQRASGAKAKGNSTNKDRSGR